MIEIYDSIDKLELDKQVLNSLKKSSINIVGDLLLYTKEQLILVLTRDINDYKYVEQTLIYQIEKIIEESGFSLRKSNSKSLEDVSYKEALLTLKDAAEKIHSLQQSSCWSDSYNEQSSLMEITELDNYIYLANPYIESLIDDLQIAKDISKKAHSNYFLVKRK